MKLLLDTHLLLWSTVIGGRLPDEGRELIEDRSNELFFSTASIWETAIKHNLGRTEFQADPALLRSELLRKKYQEIPITSTHAIRAGRLPLLHRDPFDRVLVAQAIVEEITLLTVDATLARYEAPVRLV